MVKAISIVLVAMLLASAVCCSAASVKLARSELPNTVVLSKPQPPNADLATCNGLWGRYGFVCDKEKLKKISEADSMAFKKVIDEFGLMATKVAEIIGKVSTHEQYLKILKQKLARENQVHLVEQLKSQQQIKNSKANAEACWTYMSKARSSALCSICSANNVDFFLTGKAAISLHACKRLLAACDKHLDDLYNLVLVTSYLEDLAYHDRHVGNSLRQRSIISVVSFVVHMLPITEFRQRSTDAASAKLCETLINIRATPLYVQIINLLAIMSKRIAGELESTITALKVLHLFKAAKWPSRRLFAWQQAAAESLAPVQDVVVLKPVDSMFASFDGGKGSDLHFVHGHVRPMNLTLAFP